MPSSIRVLYEDENLLALDKPAGIPTQATVDKNRIHFYELAKKHFQIPLFLHHRLDKDTSGVLLFSKSTLMNPHLSRLFKDHLIQKTYKALVRGKPAAEFTVKNFLAPINKPINKKGQKIMRSVRSGGLTAQTNFRLIQSFRQFSLMECQPLTGRTHQIRAHLSEIGHPILGDSLYGGSDPAVPRLMLHAAFLQFAHPLTDSELKMESPLPANFLTILSKQQ
jgi:RluA family pseudouridine synthase